MRLTWFLDLASGLALWSVSETPVCTPRLAEVSGVVREAAWIMRTNASTVPTAFVNVNVVPMDTERVLANQTVLVEDGKIVALGPTAKVRVSARALRIDGRGKYLIPGLADMHIHSAGDVYRFSPVGEIDDDARSDARARLVAQGITSIRLLAEGGIGVSPEQLRAIRRHFQTTELPTPRPFVSAAWPSSTPPESLAAYVAAAKTSGYDHLGLWMEGKTASVYFDSLVAAARRVGLPISEHTHALSYEQVLRIGSTGGSVEHTSTLFHALGYQTWMAPDRPKTLEVPLSKVQELAATLRRAGVWLNPSLDCQFSGMDRVFTKHWPQYVKTLHDGGVKFLSAGDESTVPRELVAMVQLAGLSPYQALLTGTRNVAEYFHRLNDLGTVAVGKRADLVLIYGNPLTDIKAIWEPAGVMVNGRWMDQAALDQSRGLKSWKAIASRIGAMGESVSHGYTFTTEQAPKVQGHRQTIRTLIDSLGAAQPSQYVSVLQRLATEFGALRTILTSEQRMAFDPLIRLGLRAEARKGYQVTVPGVAPIGITGS